MIAFLHLDNAAWANAEALTAILAFFWLVIRKPLGRLRNTLDWLDKFRLDWDGEEERPGRGRVPGVMERLNRMDGEMSHNGGSSLKDKVTQSADALAGLKEEVVELKERFDDHMSPTNRAA